MALGGSRPPHAGQAWFGQGRTSRSVQEDTIDSGLSLSAAFCPPAAGLFFTGKSQATEVPQLLASCSPSLRAAAEAPTGTG